jgi:hypothetical protein
MFMLLQQLHNVCYVQRVNLQLPCCFVFRGLSFQSMLPVFPTQPQTAAALAQFEPSNEPCCVAFMHVRL